MGDTEKTEYRYKLSVDLQVLQHLGIGLYSNVPSVVSEMVANAYDADASTVEIFVRDDELIIKDDGLGMDEQTANERFLTVGYDKRHKERPNGGGPLVTPIFDRLPMGRKGIGKLSTFAIANEVKVESIKTCVEKVGDEVREEGECGRAAFLMKVADIEAKAAADEDYHPEELSSEEFDFDRGTRITLRDLKRKRAINSDFIKRTLARRFAVFGADFKVTVDGDEVSINDRQYWDKLQFVWGLGENAEFDKAKAGRNVKNEEAKRDAEGITTDVLQNSIQLPTGDVTVTGWIGTVRLPKDLKDEGIDNNGIVIMARGKLVHENLLPFARTGMVFAEYIVGEIDADWLDSDENDDIATSDRQNLKEDDPRFAALQAFAVSRLQEIAVTWDKWRKAIGKQQAVEKHPVLQEWLDTLTKDNRRQAEKLIAVIEGMPVSNEDSKKELFKHGIMAFETLALRGNIAALENVENVDAENLSQLLDAMSELDSAHYYQIAKNRLTVLVEFRRLVDDGEKEKLIQEKLFKNLWLMEASWERATEDADMERRFVGELEQENLGLEKNDELSRFDIKYLSVSGKDLVVELKKGDRKLSMDEIHKQVRKYNRIMAAMARNVEPMKTPNFEIIVVVGALPDGYGPEDEKSLASYNARLMTYNLLIDHARAAYRDYLVAQEKIERIQALVDRLGEPTDAQ